MLGQAALGGEVLLERAVEVEVIAGHLHRWSGWLIILLPLLIACSVLLLTETTQAAPALIQTNSPSGELLFQQSQPACQTCHPEEYADWQNTVHAKAALDPVFKEQFAKSHNQGDCLKCHTTGFDTGSGKFAWEGVTCEACHGAVQAGPSGRADHAASDGIHHVPDVP